MIPVHEIINRIKWDEEFGKGDFVLGVFDRVHSTIIPTPITQCFLNEEDSNYAFTILDENNNAISIPYHRIRYIKKDGVVVWERPARP